MNNQVDLFILGKTDAWPTFLDMSRDSLDAFEFRRILLFNSTKSIYDATVEVARRDVV